MSELEKLTERVYEKYPEDNDIWLLLQEVVRMRQQIDKYGEELETLKKALSPIFLAEMLVRMREYERSE